MKTQGDVGRFDKVCIECKSRFAFYICDNCSKLVCGSCSDYIQLYPFGDELCLCRACQHKLYIQDTEEYIPDDIS